MVRLSKFVLRLDLPNDSTGEGELALIDPARHIKVARQPRHTRRHTDDGAPTESAAVMPPDVSDTPAKNFPLPFRSPNVGLYMPPKPPNPPDLIAELLALRPYIEHILCDGSRDPHVRAAAKDHVQTVMRKVVQHLPSYVPHEDGIRPWVTRIAFNEKIDVQRSIQRYEDIFGHDHLAADFAPNPGPSPERDAQVRALLDKVFALIEEMPSEMADVLILAAFCEDSHAEIAAHLQISEDAAKMRLVRARKMLRKRAGTIRDHIGVWLHFVLRKIDKARVPLLARFRSFCWQAAHLLPPVYIGLATLPQLESVPTAVVESSHPVPTRGDSLPHVPDKHASNIATVPMAEEPSILTPTQQKPTVTRSSDKPRRQTQSHREFDIVLTASPSIMADGR